MPPIEKMDEREKERLRWFHRSRSALTRVSLGCSRLQILVEPVQRVLPGFFGRRFVIAGRRVVVEAVLRVLVDVVLVRHAGRGERRRIGRGAARDARIGFAVLRVIGALIFLTSSALGCPP